MKRTRTRTRRAAGLAAGLALAVTGLTVVEAPASNAAARQCWSWSNSAPYKSVGITLYRANYSIEWCSNGRKVTEFRVVRCDAGSINPVFVRNPGSDCRPRKSLGGNNLPIYGDMWTEATVAASVKGIGFTGGRLNSHYELVLYPNGRITGSVGR